MTKKLNDTVTLDINDAVVALMSLRADAREYRKVDMFEQARQREEIANRLARLAGLPTERVK